MLKCLRVLSGYGHAGKSYVFHEGVTNITGANGVGKSLLLDYTRFALFGVKALRDKAESFPGLKVELVFQINGEEYLIQRTTRGADLSGPNGEKATGTKAVTARVIELLGCGLDVFDVANCSMQGELERFANMTPAERKKMIDNVMGLDTLDYVVDRLNDDLRADKARYDALKDNCVEPKEPVKPENYTPAKEIRVELDKHIALGQEKAYLEAKLESIPQPVPAPAPLKGPTSQELYNSMSARTLLMRELGLKQKALSLIPETKMTPAEVKKGLKEWEEYEKFLKLPQKPPVSREEIVNLLEDISTKEIIERARKNVAQAQEVKCPHCSETFKLGISEEEQALAAAEIPNTPYSVNQLAVFKHNWDLIETSPEEIQKPAVAKEDYLVADKALKSLESREALLHDIKELEENLPLDCSEKYKLRVDLEKEWEAYDEINKKRAEKPVLEARLKEINFNPDEMKELQDRFEASAAYEQNMNIYKTLIKGYAENLIKLEELQDNVEKWVETIKVIKQVKQEAKQTIIPNLQAISSRLVSKMTGGLFANIEIDESFEITVDGKSMKLLSGSEESIVNLALRLALGQTLTHKHLSLFIADELDAYMNEERSNEVMEAVLNLKGHIKQMIFVTHKELPADYEIKISA